MEKIAYDLDITNLYYYEYQSDILQIVLNRN